MQMQSWFDKGIIFFVTLCVDNESAEAVKAWQEPDSKTSEKGIRNKGVSLKPRRSPFLRKGFSLALVEELGMDQF